MMDLIVEAERPQLTLWRMRIAYWITKATDTNTWYAILIAFLRKQRLHERTSLVRYMCIASFVLPWWHTKIRIEKLNIKKMLVQTWCMSSAHQNSCYQCMLANIQFSRDSLHFRPTSFL